jgi:hypothetical protein
MLVSKCVFVWKCLFDNLGSERRFSIVLGGFAVDDNFSFAVFVVLAAMLGTGSSQISSNPGLCVDITSIELYPVKYQKKSLSKKSSPQRFGHSYPDAAKPIKEKVRSTLILETT